MTYQLKPPSSKAHPLVWFIYLNIKADSIPWSYVAKEAGIARTTYREWRKGTRSPRLRDIDAVLEVIGYRIKPTPLLPEEQSKRKKPHYVRKETRRKREEKR